MSRSFLRFRLCSPIRWSCSNLLGINEDISDMIFLSEKPKQADLGAKYSLELLN